MHQSEQVSGVVCTDTITVLLRKAAGTFGVLSLQTVPMTVIRAACTEARGWTASGPATSLYLVHLVFPEPSPAQAQTAFQHRGACLCHGQASSFHPLLPLSLPEREREMSQLDSHQRKKEKKSGRALTGPELTLTSKTDLQR